jgi:hypothetical protein
MPISTSGLSVPQVSTNYDSSIYGNRDMPKAMTIADMLDINKKQLELQKATETYAPEVAKIKAESETSQKTSALKSLELLQGHVGNIVSKSTDLLDDKNLTREKIINRYKEINANAPGDEETKKRALQQTLQGLPPEGASQTQLKSYVSRNITNGLNHLEQFEANFPSPTSVAGIPGFANKLNQSFSPINVNQQQNQAPSGAAPAGTQPQAAVVEPQKIVQETFPNRANTPYVSDTEKPKFEEGVALIKEAKQIGDAAQTQLNDIRNARKYIKSASGTALGQGSRNLAKLVAENPDLDSLIKSTAQLQMNAAARFGASTDAARETAAAAAGGADISEKALVRILDNAEADLTRDAKYSAGLQKFVQKRGNTGGTLNAADFKQAWINNAKDRKLYQLININANPELSTAQKQILRDELLQHESPTTIKALEKQLKAMKQLERGD